MEDLADITDAELKVTQASLWANRKPVDARRVDFCDCDTWACGQQFCGDASCRDAYDPEERRQALMTGGQAQVRLVRK